jgi:hypothetical protein
MLCLVLAPVALFDVDTRLPTETDGEVSEMQQQWKEHYGTENEAENIPNHHTRVGFRRIL